jgi:hypothetical protein
MPCYCLDSPPQRTQKESGKDYNNGAAFHAGRSSDYAVSRESPSEADSGDDSDSDEKTDAGGSDYFMPTQSKKQKPGAGHHTPGSEKVCKRKGPGHNHGESGADYSNGESGADTSQGESDADYSNGESDADASQGKSDADYSQGKSGADISQGKSGTDYSQGKSGADASQGKSGDDYSQGKSGADYSQGESGADYGEEDEGIEGADYISTSGAHVIKVKKEGGDTANGTAKTGTNKEAHPATGQKKASEVKASKKADSADTTAAKVKSFREAEQGAPKASVLKAKNPDEIAIQVPEKYEISACVADTVAFAAAAKKKAAAAAAAAATKGTPIGKEKAAAAEPTNEKKAVEAPTNGKGKKAVALAAAKAAEEAAAAAPANANHHESQGETLGKRK